MKQRIAMMLLVTTLALLGGCNTVRGVGKDVERAGEVIQGRSAQVESTAIADPVVAR